MVSESRGCLRVSVVNPRVFQVESILGHEEHILARLGGALASKTQCECPAWGSIPPPDLFFSAICI